MKFKLGLYCLLATCSWLFAGHTLADGSTIQIGQSLPLSGPLENYGKAKRSGAQLYVDKTNALGGIDGKRLRITTLDDKYDALQAIDNTRKLVSDHKAIGLLGYFGVPIGTAINPVLEQLKIPLVGVTSGSNSLRAKFHRYLFPVRASYADEARRLLGQISVVGSARVAIIYQSSDFGEEVRDSFLEAAKKEGLINLPIIPVKSDGSDSNQAILKLPTNIQAVFLATLSPAAIQLIAAMAQDRPRATIYGLSALDSTLLLKNLGVKASGVVQSQVMPLSSNTALAGEYHSALKQFSTNETPSYFGMEGFLEAKVLVSALRKPGASKSSQTLTTALESLSRLDVGGVEVQYSQSSRRGSSYTQLTILNDRGQVVR